MMKSTESNLNFDRLLKQVARTFYLSLTYLPEAIRLPMALAYLLARLSDTIVDAQNIPVGLRKDVLLSLKNSVEQPRQTDYLNHMHQRTINCMPFFSGPDLKLVEASLDLFLLLQQQSAPIRALIQHVLILIFEGQMIDLTYFDSRSGIVHFKTEQELDRYVYLVAGSVGEFWTQLCFTCIPKFSSESLEMLLPKAVGFGKALQLTNILRDIHRDAAKGRCYLPYAESIPIQSTMQAMDNTDLFMDGLLNIYPNIIPYWRSKASQYLKDAEFYTASIKNRRVRFSTRVPIELAHKTLAALPVKISRQSVYLTLFHTWCHTYLGLPRASIL